MAHQPPGTLLAAEDASFTIDHATIVRYGNDTTFFKQLFSAGTYVCSNTTFGGDPTPFVVKDCEVAIPPLIDAVAISYALSFPDETATATRNLPVAATSYSLTNAAATLQASRKLAVAPASYALTNSAETAVAARKLAVAATSYALSPAAVTLTYTPVAAAGAYVLPVQQASYSLSAADVTLSYSGAAPVGGGMGFEMVSFKPLLQRIMESRAERVKPATSNARKKARVIEVQAAQIALADGNEAEFRALMDRWLAQRPVMPEAQGIDPYQLFMAQVAMQIERMREIERYEQDEEDALIALLL